MKAAKRHTAGCEELAPIAVDNALHTHTNALYLYYPRYQNTASGA